MSKSTSTVHVIQVKVKPNARVSILEEVSPGVWIARLMSPPVPKPVDPTPAACAAKAIGKDGKPATGAAKDAFVTRCVIDAKAVQ